jgi:hypothetical protein
VEESGAASPAFTWAIEKVFVALQSIIIDLHIFVYEADCI